MGSDGHEASGTDGGARPSFDVLAGARGLGEVQAEGLRAAGALVDRLVRLVDGAAPVDGAPGGGGDPVGGGAPAQEAAAAAGEWFDRWVELLERATRALGGVAADPTAPRPGPTLAVGGDPAAGPPLAVRVAPGATATTELWVHNGTPDPLGPLTAAVVAPVAADGRPGPVVGLDPPGFEGLPARSSRGLLVTVAVPTGAQAGTYRGLVQFAGAPALWAVLEVEVT